MSAAISDAYREIALQSATTPRAAIIDAADYDRVVDFAAWQLHEAGYACCTKVGHKVYMHRFILGLVRGDGTQVDHIDRDKLNNRRANLRVVSPRQNAQNRIGAGRTSPFRGVHYHRASGKWMASAQVAGKVHSLGYYDDELDAAIAAERFRMDRMSHAQPDPLVAAATTGRIMRIDPRLEARIPDDVVEAALAEHRRWAYRASTDGRDAMRAAIAAAATAMVDR